MKQDDDIQKEATTKDGGSFLSRINDFFIKLMDKYTKGRYSTPEEKSFFDDDKNLYSFDDKGNVVLTQEYQRKIDELQEYVRNNSVDEFLVNVHSQGSEDFGSAYSEDELTILKNGLDYISTQQKLFAEISAAKKSAMKKSIPFNLDDYLKKKVEQEGGNYEDAKENIKQYVIEHINEISEECPEFVDFLGLSIDEVNSNKE